MKKLYIFALIAAASIFAVSCDKNEGGSSNGAAEEENSSLLSEIINCYVDDIVVPNYVDLADAALELLACCEEIQENLGAVEAETIEEAAEAWKDARLHWELSEAWLFGAAEIYGIDPHIDTWPLDLTSLQIILDSEKVMAAIAEDPGLAGSLFGEGILGFHSLEYLIFEDGEPRADTSFYTEEIACFMVGVATDLANQCIRLEAAWGGEDNVSDEKAEIIEEEELVVGYQCGEYLKGAGSNGIYPSLVSAIDEILQGAIDIADEVGSQKIGNPATGDDIDYIESPYSHNSQTDFANNIRSVQHAYCGIGDGHACVSDYIKLLDASVDAAVIEAIEGAIAAIEGCPGPFVEHYMDDAWDEASEYILEVLVPALEAAQGLLE